MRTSFRGPVLLLILTAACGSGGEEDSSVGRQDGARQLTVDVTGSLQNPAWSPDGALLLLTRFGGGYNEGSADLLVLDLGDNSLRTLVSDGSSNVNLPGSSWNAGRGEIVFSSSREPHDEIYVIDEDGSPGEEEQVTSREDRVAYEPSFSPDGEWIVFESHELDVEGGGVIVKYKLDGTSGYVSLTSEGQDCRQPNWAPAGDLIVYQCLVGDQWDLWLMSADGSGQRQLTSGSGDKTDASFSPDGQRIVYSSNEGGLEFANLFVIGVDGGSSTRLTTYDGYDGAPSWSPNGTQIAFESFPGDPDGSTGTTLWTVAAPSSSP